MTAPRAPGLAPPKGYRPKRDIPESAKTKRLAKKQEAFREKVLKKIEQETAALERKRSWGSRPFQRRAK
jgi:hypothetical protein